MGDVLKFSGFNESRFNTDFPFTLTRAENKVRKSQKISLGDADSFLPRHADSFQMNSIEPEFVTQIKVRVAGEVNVPGTYVLEKGAKLSDLLKLVGGYSDQAYPLGGVFLRESVRNLEMEIRDKAYYDLINYLCKSFIRSHSLRADSLLICFEGISTFRRVSQSLIKKAY